MSRWSYQHLVDLIGGFAVRRQPLFICSARDNDYHRQVGQGGLLHVGIDDSTRGNRVRMARSAQRYD